MFWCYFKAGRDEIAPDLDLVADVIEHIDKHGEPGNKHSCCVFSIASLLNLNKTFVFKFILPML